MKIKKYFWVVLVLGFAGIPTAAQRAASRSAPGLSSAQRLPAAERIAAVDSSLLATCGQAASQTTAASRVLGHDPQVFSANRTGITLTGVWRGSVSGNYDKQLLASDGMLNVDYYMIVDAGRGQGLVFEQFGSEGTGPQPQPGAPTWSYITCGKTTAPTFPAQVHTFVKVSNNVEDARALLTASTGQTFNNPGPLVLSDVWQQLVDTKYFDDPQRSLAYAGGFFNPFTVISTPAAGGGYLISLDMSAEYRGNGQTVLQFTPGVAIHGRESGSFVGIQILPSDTLAQAGTKGRLRAHQSSSSGDYLVASVGLSGQAVVAKDVQQNVAAANGSNPGNSGLSYSYAYDKIVIGPLAPNTATGKKHIPSSGLRNHRSKNHRSSN